MPNLNKYLLELLYQAVVQSGHRGKLQKGLPFCQLAEAGKVFVVKGAWNNEFYDDMESFVGTPETMRKIHDDTWDGVAAGFDNLRRVTTIPTFVLPNITRDSPLPS